MLVPVGLVGGIVGDRRGNYHNIAKETRCQMYLERKDLSPVANARVLVITGYPNDVQYAVARSMDLVHRLYAEERALPTTTSYTYVYGKATLYVPSHYANVLNAREDLREAIVIDGGDMRVATFEEMALGATKRLVQVYGSETEVHAAIAKLDAELQRHLVWRRDQKMEGDEVILKVVVANTDVLFVTGQDAATTEKLAATFKVVIQSAPVPNRKIDKTILTISGLQTNVLSEQQCQQQSVAPN
ncbi:hypothetical protein ACHHYP_15499 [Achlya hypogyna]|uniref:K Homology domain-containing protein n=1 Tax=Achlya hypogyna TaxID=1202772 RepID=A0A1V9ZET0_ACHHY|nr:hypothetical protein ACHHYP_15499 [Achlya hypogyna]